MRLLQTIGSLYCSCIRRAKERELYVGAAYFSANTIGIPCAAIGSSTDRAGFVIAQATTGAEASQICALAAESIHFH